MKTPFLSIVIACYNSAPYLGKLITSLKAQTYKDIEVIFIDDGSTDDTLTILMDLAHNEKQFKVFTLTSNKSPLQAKLAGVRKSNGEFIIFCDSDDTFFGGDALEKIAKTCKKFDTDISAFGHIRIPAWHQANHNPQGEHTITPTSDNQLFPSLWAKAFRNTFIKNATNHIPCDIYIRYADDDFLVGIITSEPFTYYGSADIVYSYHDNNTSLSSSKHTTLPSWRAQLASHAAHIEYYKTHKLHRKLALFTKKLGSHLLDDLAVRAAHPIKHSGFIMLIEFCTKYDIPLDFSKFDFYFLRRKSSLATTLKITHSLCSSVLTLHRKSKTFLRKARSLLLHQLHKQHL